MINKTAFSMFVDIWFENLSLIKLTIENTLVESTREPHAKKIQTVWVQKLMIWTKYDFFFLGIKFPQNFPNVPSKIKFPQKSNFWGNFPRVGHPDDMENVKVPT